MAHLTSLLFAEDEEASVGQMAPPKDIWNLPGEDNETREFALGDKKSTQKESMPLSSILTQPSPAIPRSGFQQSRVLQRRSANASILDAHKTVADFSDIVNTVDGPGTPPPYKFPSQIILSSSTAQKVRPQDNRSMVSNVGSPAGMSLSIMLDQTTDTVNYDMASKMELTELGDILGSPVPVRTGPNMNKTYLDVTLADELPQELSEMLFFSFHDHFVISTEISGIELVDYYEKECESYIIYLKKHIDRGVIPVQARSIVFEWLTTANREKFTWELIHHLYMDRTEGRSSEENMDSNDVEVTTSEHQAAQKLLETDASFRESKIILQWLERMAVSGLSNCPLQVNYVSESLRWENTLDSLKTASRNPHMVQTMDPDAVTRENKQLADIDKQDDETLTKYLFMCIRAGQLRKAQELCSRIGQHWRAATLSGAEYYDDQNYNDKEIGHKLKMPVGNKSRDLWKATTWEMAKEPSYDVYERAVYAALCGYLKPLLPVCSSWYDHLWAYMRVNVDIKLEQELRSTVYRGRQRLVEMPSEYWDQHLSTDGIFQELKSSASQVVRLHAEDPYHIVQSYVISGDLQGLVSVMYSWLNTPKATPHLMRFMAHLLLFIRNLGLVMDESQYAAILKCYIDYLIEEHQCFYMLVAVYAASLPADMQVMCYASLLRRISARHMQEDCIKRGLFTGLDVLACTKKVVDDMCRFNSVIEPMWTSASSSTTNVKMTDEDKKMMRALQWLNFEESQSKEALVQSNRLMRIFLIKQKHNAVERVFNQLPEDSVKSIASSVDAGDKSHLPFDTRNALKEYLGFKAYLDAIATYSIWFETYHKKPTRPEEPRSEVYKEKLKFEQDLRKYRIAYKRWQTEIDDLTNETHHKLQNILLFPPCGWMVDEFECHSNEAAAGRRSEEMKWLRKLCLPRVCFLLHSVLHLTENYEKCLQLADIIADENYKLYLEFRDSDLEELLKLLAKSSTSLLDSGGDGFGYND